MGRARAAAARNSNGAASRSTSRSIRPFVRKMKVNMTPPCGSWRTWWRNIRTIRRPGAGKPSSFIKTIRWKKRKRPWTRPCSSTRIIRSATSCAAHSGSMKGRRPAPWWNFARPRSFMTRKRATSSLRSTSPSVKRKCG